MSNPICWHCGREITPGSGALYPVGVSGVDGMKQYHHACRSIYTGKEEKQSVEEPKHKLIPRNDFVLVRLEKVEQVRGVAMPDIAVEGWKFIVEAVGTKDCTDLKLGDVVMINGIKGQHYSKVPNHPHLIIVRQECVILKVEPLPVESPYDQVH